MAEDFSAGAAGQGELEEPSGEVGAPHPGLMAPEGAEGGSPPRSARSTRSARAEERREDDAIGQLMALLAQCTGQAMSFKRGDQLSRAIRQMERGVKMCQGREYTHPALAVEAARARLNLGGLLSCAGRHMEAVDVIKEAQHALASILAWTDDCEPGDPGVDAIAREARSLHCAALVAEAIELEPFASAISPSHSQAPSPERGQRRRGMHEELYREAQALAQERLPPKHPMASLATRLSEECAVCARPSATADQPASGGGASAPRDAAAAAAGGRGGGAAGAALALPSVREVGSFRPGVAGPGGAAGGDTASEAPATPHPPGSALEDARSLNASGDFGASEASGMPPPPGVLQQAGSEAGRSAVAPRRSRASAHGGAGRTPGRTGSGGGQAKGERHDVFTDFLRGAELEKGARLGPLHETMQDDVRKRLSQVHRTTRLQLELLGDDELREKRYTRTGHRVFMRNLTRDNNCRSDPNLVAEARRQGESPELAQVKKLYRQLYVPPRTPEPVKVVQKTVPEVDFLKDQGANSFKRTLGFGKVPEVF